MLEYEYVFCVVCCMSTLVVSCGLTSLFLPWPLFRPVNQATSWMNVYSWAPVGTSSQPPGIPARSCTIFVHRPADLTWVIWISSDFCTPSQRGLDAYSITDLPALLQRNYSWAPCAYAPRTVQWAGPNVEQRVRYWWLGIQTSRRNYLPNI